MHVNIKVGFIFLLLFTLTRQLANSQNKENLDSRFGINKFKLESDISLYKKNLLFNTKDDEVFFYNYKGQDFNKLFGIEITQCILGFYKNKLYTISLDFGNLDNDEINRIYYYLAQLFGIDNPTKGPSAFKYEFFHCWETSKTYLAFTKYSMESTYAPGSVNIYMFSQRLDKIVNIAKF